MIIDNMITDLSIFFYYCQYRQVKLKSLRDAKAEVKRPYYELPYIQKLLIKRERKDNAASKLYLFLDEFFLLFSYYFFSWSNIHRIICIKEKKKVYWV